MAKLDSYLQLRWSSTCFRIPIWLRINHTTWQWPYISVFSKNQEKLILISAMVGHQIVKNDKKFLCLSKLSWFWLSNTTYYPFTTIKHNKAHEKGEFFVFTIKKCMVPILPDWPIGLKPIELKLLGIKPVGIKQIGIKQIRIYLFIEQKPNFNG